MPKPNSLSQLLLGAAHTATKECEAHYYLPPGTGPPSLRTFAGVAAVHMGEAGAHIMQHSPGKTGIEKHLTKLLFYFIFFNLSRFFWKF